MRSLTKMLLLGGAGLVGWFILGNLSTDALAMALGVLFGFMAAIPTVLIAISATRRNEQRMIQERERLESPATTEAIAVRPTSYVVVDEASHPGRTR